MTRGRSRARAALLLLTFLFAPAAARARQQQGLAPAPVWTSAGAAALVDVDLPAYAGGVGTGFPSLTGAWSRPWGVAGLQQREGAIFLPIGTAGLGLGWRQVSGDGLAQRYTDLSIAHAISGIPLVVGAAVGSFALGGGGSRILRRTVYRAGLRLLPSQGPGCAVSLSREQPAPDGTGRADALAWAARWRNGLLEVRLGSAGRGERALGLILDGPAGGLAAGLWGDPPAPAGAVWVSRAGLTLRMDGRWVPGPGLYLIFSTRITRGYP